MRFICFTPAPLSTALLQAGTTSSNVAFNPPSGASLAKMPQAKITTLGSTPAYIEMGSASAVAIVPTITTLGSMPIAAGETKVITTGGQTSLAAITQTGSTTLSITPGTGS